MNAGWINSFSGELKALPNRSQPQNSQSKSAGWTPSAAAISRMIVRLGDVVPRRPELNLCHPERGAGVRWERRISAQILVQIHGQREDPSLPLGPTHPSLRMTVIWTCPSRPLVSSLRFSDRCERAQDDTHLQFLFCRVQRSCCDLRMTQS